MTCEDAPCCGCCGPAVWAADAAAEAERAWDDMDDGWGPEWDDDEDDGDDLDMNEDAGMEDALFGADH